MTMQTAKLFKNGRSQAVRLPKEYRFSGKEVLVAKLGEGVLLLPRKGGWKMMELALRSFEPGFVIEREQPKMQRRRPIKS